MIEKGRNISRVISRRDLLGGVAKAGIGLFFLLPSMSVGAEKANASERSGNFVFDLSIPGIHSHTIVHSDGVEETFGIEIPVPTPTRSSDIQNLGNGYGDFKAFWYTGLLNISFWIRVDGYAISYCYDKWAGTASTPVYSIIVDWTNLDWGSTWCRMATRYHDSGFGIYETKFIEGNINGTNLVYTYWIGA